MQALLNHIRKFVPLSAAAEDLLSNTLHCKTYKRKEFLLKEGQVCHTQFFVAKGCLRMYYINDKGAEQIVQFGIDNWWLCDYKSYQLQQGSQYYIQAVTASEVISWDKHQEEHLLEHIPVLERYFRILLQRNAAAAQQRIKYIFEYSGAERYHLFNNSFPDFVQKVPQYMLASYLGFSAEFLSKIRAGKVR
jgi:CRP/FNR family transcriptional regulator